MLPPLDYRYAVLHHTTVFTAELSGIFTMVRRFIAGVCGSNGGSNADTVANAPPYTIDRLILWSYDRPPKTLSLFGWMSRAIRLAPKGLRLFWVCAPRSFFLRIARSVFVGRGLAPAVLHRHAVVYRRLWTIALLCFYCLMCILALRFGD